MTIAAGFPYRGGVLLCADTQQEGGTMKIHAPKLGVIQGKGAWKAGVVFAGNTAFALSVIQKCAGATEGIEDPPKVISVIEKVCAAEYRKNVHRHPDRNSYLIPYSLLFAFMTPGDPVALYATEDTTMHQVTDFECIGIGRDLGTYLVSDTYHNAYKESQIVVLASYVLACVSRCVPGCGGPYHFLALREDGSHEYVQPPQMSLMEDQSKRFQNRAQRLLFASANAELGRDVFEDRLKDFESLIRDIRAEAEAFKPSGDT